MRRECRARVSRFRLRRPSRVSFAATSEAIAATFEPTTAASSGHPVSAAKAWAGGERFHGNAVEFAFALLDYDKNGHKDGSVLGSQFSVLGLLSDILAQIITLHCRHCVRIRYPVTVRYVPNKNRIIMMPRNNSCLPCLSLRAGKTRTSKSATQTINPRNIMLVPVSRLPRGPPYVPPGSAGALRRGQYEACRTSTCSDA